MNGNDSFPLLSTLMQSDKGTTINSHGIVNTGSESTPHLRNVVDHLRNNHTALAPLLKYCPLCASITFVDGLCTLCRLKMNKLI